MNVDKYLAKRYSEHEYNCGHFVVELWQDITGEDISDLVGLFRDALAHSTFLTRIRGRQKLERPETPCVAIMQSHVPHAGIVIGSNELIHITHSGVIVDTITFMEQCYKIHYFK